MSVFVDRLQYYPSPSATGRRLWCHLWADSEDELHAFATRLGLRQSWFQPHRLLPHYDLTAGKRRRALSLGATEASVRVAVALAMSTAD